MVFGPWIFLLMSVISVAFSGLVGVALFTYIRRTWQLIHADQDGSVHRRILDGVDEIQMRMDLLAERMDRMEAEHLGDGLDPGLLPSPDAELSDAPTATSEEEL
mgnify:CR=1 FL=1